MARSRNIKPGFFANDELAECSTLARLLFIGLWTLADSEGRLENRPKKIKAQILPYDECDIESLVQELYCSGFIQIYTVQVQPIIQVVNFTKHQNPHINEKNKGSGLPPYEDRDIEVDKKQQHNKKYDTSTVLEPDSNHTDREDPLLRIPSYLIPDSCSPQPETLVAPRPKAKTRRKKEPAPSTATWKSYSDAYFFRYNVEPVRNATVNGQLANFLKRISLDEAPHVAAYYVGHNSSFYVQKGHSIGIMLSDAEKLRTEWATNTQMTRQTAQHVDQRQSVVNVAVEAQKIIDSRK